MVRDCRVSMPDRAAELYTVRGVLTLVKARRLLDFLRLFFRMAMPLSLRPTKVRGGAVRSSAALEPPRGGWSKHSKSLHRDPREASHILSASSACNKNCWWVARSLGSFSRLAPWSHICLALAIYNRVLPAGLQRYGCWSQCRARTTNKYSRQKYTSSERSALALGSLNPWSLENASSLPTACVSETS